MTRTLTAALSFLLATAESAHAANGTRTIDEVAKGHVQVKPLESGLGIIAERAPEKSRGKAYSVVYARPEGWLATGERQTLDGVDWIGLYTGEYPVTEWVPATYIVPWEAPPPPAAFKELKERWCSADDNWAAHISPERLTSIGTYGVKSRGEQPTETMARTGPAEQIAPNAWKLPAKRADGTAVAWTITYTNTCISEYGMTIKSWELDTGDHKACCQF